jgi:hypothetical protein
VHHFTKRFFGLTVEISESTSMPDKELWSVGRLGPTVVKPHAEVASSCAGHSRMNDDSEPFHTVRIFYDTPDVCAQVTHVTATVE